MCASVLGAGARGERPGDSSHLPSAVARRPKSAGLGDGGTMPTWGLSRKASWRRLSWWKGFGQEETGSGEPSSRRKGIESLGGSWWILPEFRITGEEPW